MAKLHPAISSPLNRLGSAALLYPAVLLLSILSAAGGEAFTITLDGAAPGRAFEGLGVVSGGGNTSRLLVDYPAQQRQEILDYLFKPGFAASLSVFKVEIGGDINSTEGSEPSHMHTRADENYGRGFEWWLMEQARARNPAIALDCLAWGAPGWIGAGNFYSRDMMDYYIKFIQGAKQYHHLDFASVGSRNERGAYNHPRWLVSFRQALNDAGLQSVKLVASDDWGTNWLQLARLAVKDPVLAHSIDAFSGHVTWSEKPGNATPEMLALGKPFWNGELHNYVPGYGGEISLVQAFNQDYIRSKITRITSWNMCWSYYPVSDYPDVGLIRANTPWSGHYQVLPVVWGFAHINQFVAPGWRFLERGGNGLLPGGGDYTSLVSPNGKDLSILVETKGATNRQTVRFQTVNGLAPTVLHVWESMADRQFYQADDITAADGVFTLTLATNTICSITTTTGQHKGGFAAPPADAPLKLPYHDDYQSYAVGSQPRLHFDYEGSFEIADRTAGPGKCLRQMATKSQLAWGGAFLPLTFLGATDWKDYSVSADTYIEQAGAVSLHGRIGKIPDDNKNDPPGYTLRVWDTGAWELKGFKRILAQGKTAFSANAWHKLRLEMRGTTISAYADGRTICRVTDKSYAYGLAGLGSGYNFAQFGNLEIQ